MAIENSQEIVDQAKKFARTTSNYNSAAIKAIKDDLVFYGGDQFDASDRRVRGEEGERAEVSINLARNYVSQIINDFRATPYGIDLTPKTPAGAQAVDRAKAIIKGLEQTQGGRRAYVNSMDRQVKCGVGYIFLRTDYADEKSFNQHICFDSILNPNMVAYDPFSRDVTGKDAKECIIVEHISKSSAQEEFGSDADVRGEGFLEGTIWQAPPDSVEVATYLKLTKTKTKIYQGEDGKVLDQSEVRKNSKLKSRESYKTTVKIWKIVGNTVVAETELPLDRLPVVRVGGEMIDTKDGKIAYKGLIHFLRGPAKLANYFASDIAERIAYGIKAQNFVDYDAVAPYIDLAEKLNKVHLPFFPIRTWDSENKREIPMPQTSGYETQVGDVSSALETYRSIISSVAGIPEGGSQVKGPTNMTAAEVLTRSKSADLANFVFFDNLAQAIKECGRVLLQLIPVIYDTPRMVPVLGDDGYPIQEEIDLSTEINPTDLDADVDAGPLYATQQAEEQGKLLALGQLLGEEGAWAVAGEVARTSAIPNGDKLAARLEQIAATKLGISMDANPDEDPDAVKALEQASQAVDALQMRLDEANNYIRILQAEAQGAEIQAKSMLIKAEMDNNTKVLLKNLDIAAQNEQERAKLLQEYQIARDKNMVELEKLYRAQPDVNIEVVPGSAPDYNVVDGMRSRTI